LAAPPQKPIAKLGAKPGPLGARAAEESEKLERHRSEELTEECARLEEEVEQLKARFELFFLGVDRREPLRERDETKRRIARLKGEHTRNTGLRFRIDTLNARFLSYERMWLRSAREKEEGTYRRDVLRARRAAERAAAEAAKAPPVGAAEPVARYGATAPPRATPVPGIDDSQLRELHAAFVAAKRQCNEDTARFTVEALAASLAKQVPTLLSRLRATRVEFRVAVKDGKAILKALPRT
jgi:hypothetical protein